MNELYIARREKLKKFILIIIILLIIGGVVFTKFAIDSSARNMFREAKNVQLALDMLSVEYYGKDMSIYDENNRDGLADGVEERIEALSGEDGDIYVTAYNFKRREVTGFVYERGIYRVIYTKSKDDIQTWKVDLIINVFRYDKIYED